MAKHVPLEIAGQRSSSVAVKKGNAPARRVSVVLDETTSSGMFRLGHLGTAEGTAQGVLAKARSHFNHPRKTVFDLTLNDPGPVAADGN